MFLTTAAIHRASKKGAVYFFFHLRARPTANYNFINDRQRKKFNEIFPTER